MSLLLFVSLFSLCLNAKTGQTNHCDGRCVYIDNVLFEKFGSGWDDSNIIWDFINENNTFDPQFFLYIDGEWVVDGMKGDCKGNCQWLWNPAKMYCNNKKIKDNPVLKLNLYEWNVNQSTFVASISKTLLYTQFVSETQFDANSDFFWVDMIGNKGDEVYVHMALTCGLQKCDERNYTETGTCQSFLDSSPCYRQLSNSGDPTGRCVPYCIANLSTTNNECELLACNKRKPQNANSSYLPCGWHKNYVLSMNDIDCFVQQDNVSCGETCGDPNLSPRYKSDDDSVWGYCNRSLCHDRTPDHSLRYPCITRDCYEQVEEIQESVRQLPCNFPCDYPTNYVPVNGKCVLKDCASRVYSSDRVNGKNPYPCGEPTCYLQWYSNSCTPLCAPAHFIGDNASGKCVLKDCDARTSDGSRYNPCGDGRCYQQMDDGVPSNTCGSICPSTDHTTEHRNNYVCVLKPCDSRIYNASASYPCGEATCFQQMENGTATSTCGLNCPSDYTVEDNITGRCVVQDCDQREFNSSTDFPCGANCYQQIENGIASVACGSECPSDHTIADNSIGRCVLKECDQRVYNASAFYPCGEASCYQQMKNGISTNDCGLDCVSSKHDIADETTGRCVGARGGFNTVIVLSTVIPVVVVVVIVLTIAGFWYLKKKSRAEKSSDHMLGDDVNSLDSKSVNDNQEDSKSGTVRMVAEQERNNEDYPRLPEHPLGPACSTPSEYPRESTNQTPLVQPSTSGHALISVEDPSDSDGSAQTD